MQRARRTSKTNRNGTCTLCPFERSQAVALGHGVDWAPEWFSAPSIISCLSLKQAICMHGRTRSAKGRWAPWFTGRGRTPVGWAAQKLATSSILVQLIRHSSVFRVLDLPINKLLCGRPKASRWRTALTYGKTRRSSGAAGPRGTPRPSRSKLVHSWAEGLPVSRLVLRRLIRELTINLLFIPLLLLVCWQLVDSAALWPVTSHKIFSQCPLQREKGFLYPGA